MPYGDQTGPQGQGPMTGRGAGSCAGNNMQGSANAGFGFGRGRGGGGRRGGGFGFRHNNYGMFGQAPGWNAPLAAAPTTEQELAVLKNQADSLKNSLDAIEKRMKDLGNDKDQ